MKLLALTVFVTSLFLLSGCQKGMAPTQASAEPTTSAKRAIPTPDKSFVPQAREGFKVTRWADVKGARSLALSPDGKLLFVGTRAGIVYKVSIGEGAAKVETFVQGLDGANGVCFVGPDLYVGELEKIVKYSAAKGFAPDTQGEVILDGLPAERRHGWRYLKTSPDGDRIYMGIGAPCNVCEKEDPRFSTLCSFTPEGKDFQIEAKGVRNTVGFDWHPKTGDLYFTDNGRDMLGDNIPPCELNVLPKGKRGEHYGFPYFWGDNQPDPEFGTKAPEGVEFVKPVHGFPAHVAPLGCYFPRTEALQEALPNQILVTQHGSWNRSSKVGYQVVTVDIDKPEKTAEPFLFGFLAEDQSVSGRPVDVLELPDGSVLVSDDYAGAIWKVEQTASE